MPDQGTALPTGQGASRRDQAHDEPIAYTVAKFARLLGKHPNTVYGWVKNGAVPHERIGDTIYIPKWALGCLPAPAEQLTPPTSTQAVTPDGSEAA
ncbi:MAG TPA: helix-turn-helix domain-containing protein [Gemmataceae bacterium]|nr:helix-turn-helix domain-containing protein [Gemmataceae bacterium]